MNKDLQQRGQGVRKRIRAVLGLHPTGINSAAIAAALEIDTGMMARYIGKMMEEGQIRRINNRHVCPTCCKLTALYILRDGV